MDKEKPSLQRSIGLAGSILLVSGLMIGTGVFKKIAPMAQSGIGEGYILLAWSIAGLVTVLGAFTYAGLSLLSTETGGVYEYLRLSFGNFISFLYGWAVFMIIGSGSIAALGFIIFQSVNSLDRLPEPLFAGSGIKVLGVGLIWLLTWLNCRGIRKGSDLNVVVTLVKIAGMVLLIGSGLFFSGHPPLEKSVPAVIHPLTGFALFSGLFGSMLSALYAYDGWANITFISGEIKNPRRNLPIAIVAGVGIVLVLYVLLNFSYMRVLPVSRFAGMSDNTIAGVEVAKGVFGPPGAILMALFIIISGFGALNACIIVFSRVYFRMAQEQAFFSLAAKVHPRFRTPFIALYISAAWCSILVLSGSFEVISNMVIFSGYIFFALAAWGLIRMKRKRAFPARVWAYPFAPVTIILFCITLLTVTVIREPLTSLTAVALIAGGLPFYWYFRRQSKVAAPINTI
ncbi:MAG TPA: amino acid permease [Mucilaginibacter sp.]|nr:amino acid permease [Mucilaginibacter sp.]